MYGSRVSPDSPSPLVRKTSHSALTGSNFIHGRSVSLSLTDRMQISCYRIAILIPCLFAGLLGISIGTYQLIMSEELMKRSITYVVVGGGVTLLVTYLAIVICCRVRFEDLPEEQRTFLGGNIQETV